MIVLVGLFSFVCQRYLSMFYFVVFLLVFLRWVVGVFLVSESYDYLQANGTKLNITVIVFNLRDLEKYNLPILRL